MIKILLIETARISESTTIAHVRNSIAIADGLRRHGAYVVLTDIHSMDIEQEQFDAVLFSYSCGFGDFSRAENIIDGQSCAKVGWITNEFELFANDFIKQRMSFMITNFDKMAIKKAHNYSRGLLVTNLNSLMAKKRNPKTIKTHDIVYYGTYRKYRQPYFKKYLQGDMILSTSKKNVKDYLDAGALCYLADPLCWDDNKEDLNCFRASLYIEDTKTHDWYNHLANRFYEGLFCNTPCYFDASCKNTIKKSGYTIDDHFIVGDLDEALFKARTHTDKAEHYLQLNTLIALKHKEQCIREIYDFLNKVVVS